MRGGGKPFSSNRREKGELGGVDERERDKREKETRVCGVMDLEVEECTITTLFYASDWFVPFRCRPSFFLSR